MKIIRNLLVFLFITRICYGQISIDQRFIDKIDLGYTTRWDIEQQLGKGIYLDNKIVDPENEQDSEPGLVHGNGLFYPASGLLFICARDGELISGIEFIKPYRAVFSGGDTISIGETKLGDAFPFFDTIAFSTTGISKYWSFQQGKYELYVEKPDSDKRKDDVPEVKGNIPFYRNQIIHTVTLNLYNSNEYFTYPSAQNEGNLYCSHPAYAPKSEDHLNCYELGWSKSLHWIFVPFYALLGGQRDRQIKQGYWKEYSPRHMLIYEGEFKNGEKIGAFKYYDTNGKLERTENYKSFKWLWLLTATVILLSIFLVFIRYKSRKK